MASGCSVNPASIQNMNNTECRSSLETALISILIEENEKKPSEADMMIFKPKIQKFIAGTFDSQKGFGFSLSGTTYQFMFDESKGTCILNLYQKSSGNTKYTNRVTYINSKEVQGCYCKK
jgi:hypothetical protein